MSRVFALIVLLVPWMAGMAGSINKVFVLSTVHDRLMISATVNGYPVSALLDSGAEATLIDRHFAQSLNLHQGKEATGQGSGQASFEVSLVSGVTLGALGLTLPDQTVGVADLADVGHRLMGKRIDAILGREIFDAARLSIDISGGRIAVLSSNTEPRGVRLDLVSEHGLETVPVRVEGGHPVRASFDLGNGSRVLLGSGFATKMGFLTDRRQITTERGGGLGGESIRQVITLRSIEIGGRRFSDVSAAIDPQPSASDVNIGVRLLRHFDITTDFAAHSVWLAPRKVPGK
jgi:predicted aspartyl protease